MTECFQFKFSNFEIKLYLPPSSGVTGVVEGGNTDNFNLGSFTGGGVYDLGGGTNGGVSGGGTSSFCFLG